MIYFGYWGMMIGTALIIVKSFVIWPEIYMYTCTIL